MLIKKEYDIARAFDWGRLASVAFSIYFLGVSFVDSIPDEEYSEQYNPKSLNCRVRHKLYDIALWISKHIPGSVVR